MHPVALSKRLDTVDQRIAALARQLADVTGQTFAPPQGFETFNRNQGAPLDTQLLYHAEVTAEVLRLIVAALQPATVPE
jgi:hypothetical protein